MATGLIEKEIEFQPIVDLETNKQRQVIPTQETLPEYDKTRLQNQLDIIT